MPLKVLFSRRYILTTLFVLLAMAVMVRLGVWQLDRRQQRLARNADVIAKFEQPPQSLNDVVAGLWSLPQDRDEVRNLKATATGQFDYEQQVLLLQQPLENRPGMHLVAPLVLDGTDKAVLVDRGWIPEEDAGNPAQFNTAAGQVTVNGLLQPPQILFGRAAERAAESPDQAGETKAQWYRIDVEGIQAQVPYELLPVYLLQSPPPEGNLDLPIRVEPEFDLSEGSHMSYALQWFAFAATAGVIYASIVRSRERKRVEVKAAPPAGFAQDELEGEAEVGQATVQGVHRA